MKGGGKLEKSKKAKRKTTKPKVIKVTKPIITLPEVKPKEDIKKPDTIIPMPVTIVEPKKPELVCPKCGGTDIKSFEGNDECMKCGFKSSARYHFKPS